MTPETRTARVASVVEAVKNAHGRYGHRCPLVALRVEEVEALPRKCRFAICRCTDHADPHIHVPLRPR